MTAACSEGAVSAEGQMSDMDFSLRPWTQRAWQSSLSRHGLGQLSRRGSSSLKLYSTQINMFCQWVSGSTLFFVVVCRGGSNKAEEAGRINILVKKTPSVVWLNTEGLEAQAEGGWRPNWTVLNNTSHPSVNQSSNPLLSLHLLAARYLDRAPLRAVFMASHFAGLHCLLSSFKLLVVAEGHLHDTSYPIALLCINTCISYMSAGHCCLTTQSLYCIYNIYCISPPHEQLFQICTYLEVWSTHTVSFINILCLHSY